MPIVDLGIRLRELGRLRLGRDAGDRPEALEVWRLTSPHEDLLIAAAELYGPATLNPWQDGYELITAVSELPVLVPVQDLTAGQWFELWQGSTISRRCDGVNLVELDSNGHPIPAPAAGPCLCEPDARECKPTTVLRVVLPELPDLGVWRLVTRSIYAALELPGAVNLLVQAHGGELGPGILSIESRRGAQRRPFMVPVLRSTLTLTELTALEASASPPPANAPRLDTPSPGRPASPLEALPLEPHAAGLGSETHTDEDGPHGDGENPGPSVPPLPKRAQWEDLGRLIRANLPTNLPKTTSELIEVLLELEALMVETRLWPLGEVAPLDASAAKHHLTPWRQMDAGELTTFAKRAIMVAGTLYADHRFGIQIIRELDLDEANA